MVNFLWSLLFSLPLGQDPTFTVPIPPGIKFICLPRSIKKELVY